MGFTMTQDQLERFSTFCGPTAIASALGISKIEAARRILEVRTHKLRFGVSTMLELSNVVKRSYQVVTKSDVSGSGRRGGAYWYRAEGVHPTLVQWLRANPTANAILRVTNHFVHVNQGKVVGDSMGLSASRRKRVTHQIMLPPKPLPAGVGRTCLCGCGGRPKGKRSRFLPGHDARYYARIGRKH